MFARKEENTKAIDTIYGLFINLGRGDSLAWEEIETTLAASRDDGNVRHVVKEARKRLFKETGIATWILEFGVGIRLLTNQEQIRVPAEKRQRRMARQAHRAIKELSAVDPQSVGTHDNRLRLAQLTMLRAQRRDARKQARIVTKTEVNPQRKLG